MSSAIDDIDVIFWEAAQRAAGPERDAYLAQACGDDRELRRRVEQLVRAHPQLDGFLEQPFAGPAPVLDSLGVGEGPGSVIGSYKLLEQIGEGGMGLVFMAEQSQPVRRRVALKIVKPGMDTKQVVARFEAERQALALMDHPNIAHVYDAGTTATGRPYFVMELVRGVPITDFCDQHRLDTRRRLELFVQVCRAVQHAHQKGIIHRDLKPGNVLVTLHDTVAVPKIIDFGIAKATGQRLTERTLFTHFAQMVGTPMYMSPEQAEMNGLDVDTRSDVYSLGVLLYELLTGTTPFESEKLKQVGFDEMRRLIREEEPPRPSERVVTLPAAALTTLSERRGVDGRRFGPMLRGELDWVVMRALEKDRNRRYESASALAADVERNLADEPVNAGPPSAVYRLRKFVRRNRRGLVAAGMVAAALVAATGVSTWQAIKATDAEHRAATEAAIAKAVNDFLQNDLLRQVDIQTQYDDGFVEDPNLTVKEALNRAGARIGNRFQDQPLVEAAIRNVIGDACIRLGDANSALTHIEKAFALRQSNLGVDHPSTVASMGRLAGAYAHAGHLPEAIALFEKTVEKRKTVLGLDHPLTLGTMSGLAQAYEGAGFGDRALLLKDQTLKKRLSLLGSTHPDTLGCMHELAMTYTYLGRFDDAFALYQTTLDTCKQVLGRDHARTTGVMFSYGRTCLMAGKIDEAEQLACESLLHREKQGGSNGMHTTADSLALLCMVRLEQERYVESEQIARRAQVIYERLWSAHDGPQSFRPFFTMNLVGSALMGQKRYDEAEPFLLQGYVGMSQRRIDEGLKYWLTGALERVIQFYELTNQPEKARAWQEKRPPKN